MRFENVPESRNVQDRRGSRVRRGGAGFPLSGLRLPIGRGRGRGGIGIGVLLLLIALAWFTGFDPLGFGFGSPAGAGSTFSERSVGELRTTPEEEALRQFIGRVLTTTEECWSELMPAEFGRDYVPPSLVLFRDAVQSACGIQGAAVGPFYCPSDQSVYIDLSFLDEMDTKLGAAGDFAQAYVIAHEVGHHVQNLIGTSRRAAAAQGRGLDANQASVRVELQADYFAGVWAHYVETRMRDRVELEVGDFEEAIRAARAVGDDVLQRRATGRVVPENFTHGTAEQRAKWFRLGYESGDPDARDPFVEEK